MPKTPWPMPEWLEQLPEEEREAARIRFILCLAVAYAGDKVSTADLSREIGLNPQGVNGMKHRGSVAPEIAVKLETLLGRKLFPRELFRPKLFTIPAE